MISTNRTNYLLAQATEVAGYHKDLSVERDVVVHRLRIIAQMTYVTSYESSNDLDPWPQVISVVLDLYPQ
jgi:hypothetical protein